MKFSDFRPGQRAMGAALIAMALALGVGLMFGLALALLVLASAALLAVLTLLWLSVRNLGGETPLSLDEALGLGAPTAAEEQKRSVLRALKDLEFERSVGKISEQDYLEFSARYRAEARRLIASVDESLGPVQQMAEDLAQTRLRDAGLGTDKPAATESASAPATKDAAKDMSPADDVSAESESAESESAESESAESDAEPTSGTSTESIDPERSETDATDSAARACAGCGTPNDPDAVFCKRCGAPFEKPKATERRPNGVVEEESP